MRSGPESRNGDGSGTGIEIGDEDGDGDGDRGGDGSGFELEFIFGLRSRSGSRHEPISNLPLHVSKSGTPSASALGTYSLVYFRSIWVRLDLLLVRWTVMALAVYRCCWLSYITCHSSLITHHRQL